MMILIVALALVDSASEKPYIKCAVDDKRIIVRFREPSSFLNVDKFAVVQGNRFRNGRWLYVIDDRDPPLRLSSYRPGAKRLVVDVRRQLAVRDDDDGKGRIVHAFAKPGPYTLVFSDNLGIDYGNMISLKCRVRIR